MNYLLIENKGEIDINSLILMGGSTKTGDDSKIGQWGSGNKYAIACLIRNNIPFKIFSGGTEISIETKDVSFRGKSFKQIIIDGKETSLTTQMGFDWEVWYAIREIVSNCMDEEQSNIITSIENISPKEGFTRVYIEHTSQIKEVIDNWDAYFAFDRTDILYENNGNRILSQNDPDLKEVLFRKSICCHNSSDKALFQYDLTNFEINESRIVKSQWDAHRLIREVLIGCDNKQVISVILNKSYSLKTIEADCGWSYGVKQFSPTWRSVIGDKRIIPGDIGGWFIEEQQKYDCLVLSLSLCTKIKRDFPDVYIYGLDEEGTTKKAFKEIETTPRIEFLLKECDRFFTETKYSVNYPIQVVDFVDSDKLGNASNNTIYISKKLFDMGKREIISAIIEENEHLNTQYKDCTRAFQQHFINMFISEKEERFAFFC